MTILIYCSCMFWHIYLSHQSMEKSSVKTSKSSSPTSDLSNNGRLKSCSVLPRHHSFSSCSNDSSVSDNCVLTRRRNTKRMFAEESVQSRKRSRNSSGSSLSSNVSGISDKDLKSAGIISQTETEVKSYITSNQKSPYLNYSKVNSSRIELKKKTINDKFDCSENTLVTAPNRHNLRGKITKKGCTCCPSTCATVVFRRSYKRYVKTGEEKTVISSTKVRTYIKKTSPPNITEINEKNNNGDNSPNSSNNNTPCNKSRSRKRKSEVEKLYESLHEIEWAKNFSPDNILRQISVRQAAACSVFGHTQTNLMHSPKKNSKKHIVAEDLDNVDSLLRKTADSEINPENIDSSSCEVNSNMNKETHIVTNCDNEQNIADLHTAQITTSVNISSCSMPHLNVKEISINTRETVHAESLMMENGADSSDDAQLCYTSDESSSAISSNIVSLQSKHSLDFSYAGKKRNYNLADVIPEYSATATFFDIAEEGIRTIDACFREVGAEVVVSTCYEDENSLPLLTSVKESKISNKILNDSPPVLEPCIDVSFNCERSSLQKHNKRIKKKKFKCYSKNFGIKNKNSVVRRVNSHFSNSQSVLLPKTLKKICASSNLYCNKLKITKKIVKKYLKFLLNKSRLKHLFKERFNYSTSHKLTNGLDICFSDRKTSDLNKHNSSIYIQNAVLSSSLSKSHAVPCELVHTKPDNMIFHHTRSKKYTSNKIKDDGMQDFVKNGSCLYNRKELRFPTEINKLTLMSQSQSSATHSRSAVASFVTTKVKKNDGFHDEQITRPPPLYGYSSDYKSIRVHRSHNYTHVILLVTRGKSIFLTLEVLRELRDALIRSNSDSNCPVLIINGVGDSFCSGLDVTPLVGPRKKIASTELAIAIKRFIEALSDFKKPLAAVVNGPALGLGMTLLNHVDMIIASEKATFCMPYSVLGYMPEGGATLTLPQIVGSTVAMDLLIRGKTLTAREACNVGLISEVYEARLLPHELVSRLRSLAENSLSALETTKALLKMQLHLNLRLVLENEVKLLPRMWLTRTCQDSLRKALNSGILSG